MSISQLQNTPQPIRTEERPAQATPRSGSGPAFDAILALADNARGKDRATVVATAAEVLRLEMMRSALATDDGPSPTSPAREALQAFLEVSRQGGQNSVANQPASPAAVVPKTAPPAPPQAQEPAATGSIDGIIQKASRRYGVDAGLIKAVVKAESNFNPRAVSSAGAQGLMQLMPATARQLGVTNAFDPEQNVMAGTRFLKELLERYNGNMDAALAAYNWGPGNVDRKGLGSALPTETRAYLARVKNLYSQNIA